MRHFRPRTFVDAKRRGGARPDATNLGTHRRRQDAAQPSGARVLLFGTGALPTVVDARTVVAVWLAGTIALGAGAYFVTRAMCRDFDVEVGRPTRYGS